MYCRSQEIKKKSQKHQEKKKSQKNQASPIIWFALHLEWKPEMSTGQ